MGELIHTAFQVIFKTFPILLVFVLIFVVIVIILKYSRHIGATSKVALRRGKEYCDNSALINKAKGFTEEVKTELQSNSSDINKKTQHTNKSWSSSQLIGASVLCVFVVIVLIVLFSDEPKSNMSAKAVNPETTVVTNIYSLEPFIVNIRDGQDLRYLRIKVEMEMANTGVKAEIEGRLAPIRDDILKLMESKTLSDIESMQGKNHIKEEMIGVMDRHIQPGKIAKVYFTDFAVQ